MWGTQVSKPTVSGLLRQQAYPTALAPPWYLPLPLLAWLVCPLSTFLVPPGCSQSLCRDPRFSPLCSASVPHLPGSWRCTVRLPAGSPPSRDLCIITGLFVPTADGWSAPGSAEAAGRACAAAGAPALQAGGKVDQSSASCGHCPASAQAGLGLRTHLGRYSQEARFRLLIPFKQDVHTAKPLPRSGYWGCAWALDLLPRASGIGTRVSVCA